MTARSLSPSERIPRGAPAAFEPDGPRSDEVLTREQVAALLQVKPRQVERLGVPVLDLGRKTKRYLRKDVFGWLAAHRRHQLDKSALS